jgi:acylphosphatase
MADERLEAVVGGRVQGVGFRWHVERTANDLSLAGWVKNDPEGTVRLVAEGPKEKLDELLRALRKGPAFARVDFVDAKWFPGNGEFKSFQITH